MILVDDAYINPRYVTRIVPTDDGRTRIWSTDGHYVTVNLRAQRVADLLS